jgi:hypothetical protein
MGRAPTGLPHSDSSGSQAASASPEHFAAWPRPSSAAIAKASTLRPSSGRLLHVHCSISCSIQDRPFGRALQTGSRQPRTHPSLTPPDGPPLPPGLHPVLGVLAVTGQLLCAHSVRVDVPARPRSASSSTAARSSGSRVAHCQGAKLGSRWKEHRECVLVLTIPPHRGGRAWTRTRDLGLIRAAL